MRDEPVCSHQNLFRRFKEQETFSSLHEASCSMNEFIRQLAEDNEIYGPLYRSALIFLCRTVLEKLQETTFPELAENETCEWLITRTGVALVQNRYHIDPTIDISKDQKCIPWDFESNSLCAAEMRESVSLGDFTIALSIRKEQALTLLETAMRDWYQGDLSKPETIRISLCATLYAYEKGPTSVLRRELPYAKKQTVKLA